MTTKAGVEKAVDAVKRSFGASPDIAIGSVGTTRRFGFDDCSDDDFRLACEEVVMATVYLARAVAPAMKAKGWGRMVSISMVAVKEPHRTFHVTLANTFRPVQQGLNKALSNEFSEFEITFNSLLLGRIDTGRHQKAVETAASRGVPKLAEPEPRIPVGRPGRAEEVAAMCIFLCSERASYITGQAIPIDGGWLKSLF